MYNSIQFSWMEWKNIYIYIYINIYETVKTTENVVCCLKNNYGYKETELFRNFFCVFDKYFLLWKMTTFSLLKYLSNGVNFQGYQWLFDSFWYVYSFGVAINYYVQIVHENICNCHSTLGFFSPDQIKSRYQ